MSVEKMRDDQKTKAELLQEVETLRRRVAELEGNKLEHKKAEEVLAESEGRYRSLTDDVLDSSKVGIFILDKSFEIVWVNQAMERYFGLRREEVIGKDKRRLIRKRIKDIFEDPETFVEKVFATYDNNTYIENFECHVLADGQREDRWLEHWSQPIGSGLFAGGRIEHYTDITEHKRAEETLRLRNIAIESSINGIAFVDIEGNLIYVNDSFLKLWGYSDEKQVLGKPAVGFWDDVDKATEIREIVSNKGSWTGELVAKRKDGSTFDVELSAGLVKDENANPVCIMASFIDITERKRMEDTRWESEKRFREIFENIAVGVYRTAPDGQILMANPALVHMLGYSSFEELSQRNLEEEGFELPYERSMFIEEIEREGRIVGSESTWITRDGKKLHVIENARAVRDEDGKTLYYEGTAENITERKQAEEALQESENKYRKLFNDIADPIFVADFETGILIDCNRAASELVGREKSELIGKHQRILHPPKETEEEFSRTFEQHGKEKRGQVLEAQVITKKGEIKDVAIRAGFTEIEDKKRILFGMFRDITDHKRAEETLRESEKKYKALFQGAAEGIIVADTETKDFKYVNPAICKMLGYTENELEQMGIRDIHPKEDLEYIISEFEAQAGGEKTLSSNIPYLRKDGTIMYADINTAMVLMDGRQYNVGFFTDITEVKRAQMELNEYREKMARAERLASVGTLSAIMAHTLNDLLTVIQLSIQEAMEESKKTPRQSTITKYLKEGLRSVSEVSSTVQRLGKFASESSKEIISEVNLKAVAERTVKLLSESARRTKMSLYLEGMGELPPIYSSERGLEQLFFSLAENAIQAADGKKSHQLIISGAVKDEEIELRFTDNCSGITQENLDKIFELFFTTKPADERTGLGLCIVDRIVSEADGNIRVESKAGKGSTFFVTLPLCRGRRS